MGLQVAHDDRLCRTHLGGLGIEVVVGDPPVQFVLVHAVNTVLHPAVLTLKLCDGIVAELAFIPMAFA